GSIAYDSAGDNHGVVAGADWVEGVLGGALSFYDDGANVEIPDDDSLTPTNAITVAFWRNNGGAGIYKMAFCPDQSASPGNSRAYWLDATWPDHKIRFHVFSSVNADDEIISEGTYAFDEWHHVVGTFDRGKATIYGDGQFDSSKNFSVTSIMNDVHPLFVGGYWSYCGEDHFVDTMNGCVDDFRIYNRALSAGEVAELYREQPGDGLVGHWKFDEGEGDVAYDSARDNDGTIYGAEWADGILGQALSFDGLGDDGVYMESSSDEGSPLNIYNKDLTISAWVKSEGGGTIVARARPHRITYRLGIGGQSAYINTYRSPTHWTMYAYDSVTQDDWHHVVGVFDRAQRRGRLYVDGRKEADEELGADPPADGGITKIGCRNDTADFPFTGSIDDVRIYSRVLSSAEVLELYGARPDEGLVGHWKFDEGEGDVAQDSAGNNDGTVYGATWAKGILDGALNFDGWSDYVEVASSEELKLNSAGTISAWINPRELYRNAIVDKRGDVDLDNTNANYFLTLGSYNQCSLVISDGTTWIDVQIPQQELTTNTWQHVTGTWNASDARIYLNSRLMDVQPNTLSDLLRSDAYPLRIGSHGADVWHFNGYIDDARIYDRDLSAAEVAELYGQGADDGLVAHWKFDEGQGSVAHDSAGTNDGTVYGAAWADGILDGALDFDGDDDYVSLSQNAVKTTELTVSAWANHTGPGGGSEQTNAIFQQRNDAVADGKATILLMSEFLSPGVTTAIVRSSANPGGDRQELNAPRMGYGEWHHYALTVGSNDIVLYIDGADVADAAN
ncbi:MAG: LamG domain-containing protein, partial [Planctomycetota bacterium]